MKIEDLTKLGVAEDTAQKIIALNEAEVAAESRKLIGVLYDNCREVYKVCSAVENLYGSPELWHVRIEGK